MGRSTTRAGGRRALAAAVAALAIGAAACEATAVDRVDARRAAAGVDALVLNDDLTTTARARAADLCAAGAAVASTDPRATYPGETAADADELVGSAPLDPAIADWGNRNGTATNAVWAGWADDPTLVDERWDRIGVGEHECADGNLYLVLALRDDPTMPASGRYSSRIIPAASVVHHEALVYGTAVNHTGVAQPLLLDLFVPPAGPTPTRPLVVFVHGGGYFQGSRTDFEANARDYARRGYVVATVDYRLRPNDTPEEQLVAATQATDDVMESVRWLKANAATYGIDPTRIVALGTSAGGGITLALAHGAPDPTPGGPLAAFAPTVTAAVSNGASLDGRLDLFTFRPTDAPTMMFHFETDTSTGVTAPEALETCLAIRAGGATCDFRVQAGAGHAIGIGPGAASWASDLGPFIWQHLDLHP